MDSILVLEIELTGLASELNVGEEKEKNQRLLLHIFIPGYWGSKLPFPEMGRTREGKIWSSVWNTLSVRCLQTSV